MLETIQRFIFSDLFKNSICGLDRINEANKLAIQIINARWHSIDPIDDTFIEEVISFSSEAYSIHKEYMKTPFQLVDALLLAQMEQSKNYGAFERWQEDRARLHDGVKLSQKNFLDDINKFVIRTVLVWSFIIVVIAVVIT